MESQTNSNENNVQNDRRSLPYSTHFQNFINIVPFFQTIFFWLLYIHPVLEILQLFLFFFVFYHPKVEKMQKFSLR